MKVFVFTKSGEDWDCTVAHSQTYYRRNKTAFNNMFDKESVRFIIANDKFEAAEILERQLHEENK